MPIKTANHAHIPGIDKHYKRAGGKKVISQRKQRQARFGAQKPYVRENTIA